MGRTTRIEKPRLTAGAFEKISPHRNSLLDLLALGWVGFRLGETVQNRGLTAQPDRGGSRGNDKIEAERCLELHK